MTVAFNADEIFDICITIEENGKRFYDAAAKAATHQNVKNLFTELASWETMHIVLFTNLKNMLSGRASQSATYDPDNELADYVHAFASGHVFKSHANVDAIIDRCKSAADALSMALGFEKDSVVLYAGLVRMVPADMGRAEVEKILTEEIKHVGIIMKEMEKLI